MKPLRQTADSNAWGYREPAPYTAPAPAPEPVAPTPDPGYFSGAAELGALLERPMAKYAPAPAVEMVTVTTCGCGSVGGRCYGVTTKTVPASAVVNGYLDRAHR